MEGQVEIQAYTHHISDFIQAGSDNGLGLLEFRELWPGQDEGKPPRLASFLFGKSSTCSNIGSRFSEICPKLLHFSYPSGLDVQPDPI
jgi:hypothetical protein